MFFYIFSAWVDIYAFTWKSTTVRVPVNAEITDYLNIPSVEVITNNGELYNGVVDFGYGYDGTTVSTVNTNILGRYSLIYKASIRGGGTYSKQTVVFEVYDDIAPTFDFIPRFVCEYGEELPNFLSGLEYHDNYFFDKVKATCITDKINPERLGTYDIEYWLVDESMNIAKTKTSVKLVDTIEPVIVPFVHTVSIGEENDYCRGVIAYDNYDGDISSDVQYDISGVDINQVGTYEINYMVQDSSGNKAEVDSVVYVVDDVSPVIELNQNYYIHEIGEEPTDTMYYSLVKRIVDNEALTVESIIVDDENVDYSQEGKYLVKLLITDSKGNSGEASIMLSVMTKRVEMENTINQGLVIFAKDKTLSLNQQFDPLLNVKAYDDTLDITDRIQVIFSNVNVQKSGKYLVVYEVFADDGQFIREVIECTVGDAKSVSVAPVFPEEIEIDIEEEVIEVVSESGFNGAMFIPLLLILLALGVYFIVRNVIKRRKGKAFSPDEE